MTLMKWFLDHWATWHFQAEPALPPSKVGREQALRPQERKGPGPAASLTAHALKHCAAHLPAQQELPGFSLCSHMLHSGASTAHPTCSSFSQIINKYHRSGTEIQGTAFFPPGEVSAQAPKVSKKLLERKLWNYLFWRKSEQSSSSLENGMGTLP